MKILVSGAAGFIAFHLIHRLLNEGNSVVGIDNFLSGQKKNIDDLLKLNQFDFFECDIIDLNSNNSDIPVGLEKHLTGIDRIYHLACPASPPIYQKAPLHTLDTCYLGSKNLLRLAEFNRCRILLASTSEIYGDPEVHPQHEDYRGNVNTMGPRSCYDEGKRIMETLGYVYLQQGVAVRTARIFNTYGPRMSPSDGRILSNFISQALRGDPFTIYGDGKQTRSLCYCEDTVAGLMSLMESDVTEPVNLGSDFEMSILEIASVVKDLTGHHGRVSHKPLPKDDPIKRRADWSRAYRLLGWQPKTLVKEGISKMISDYKTTI